MDKWIGNMLRGLLGQKKGLETSFLVPFFCPFEGKEYLCTLINLVLTLYFFNLKPTFI